MCCSYDIRNDEEFFGQLEHGIAPNWLKVIERGDSLALYELSTAPGNPPEVCFAFCLSALQEKVHCVYGIAIAWIKK